MFSRYFYGLLPQITMLSGEDSLWKELWDYINGKYLTVEMGRYQHLNMGTGTLVTARNIILGICIGIIIASIMISYEKNKKGKFVRKIIKEQCFWPDKAQTLAELGFEKNYSIKSDLRRVSVLSKVVKCVEREAFEARIRELREAHISEKGNDKDFVMPKYNIDFNTAHFYIPDDEHYAADIRYDNQGSGWRAMILVILVTVIIAVLVCFLLPDMMQLVDNMMDIIKEDKSVVN